MCGILGQINFTGKPVDTKKLVEARDLLAHRGPDDAGFYVSNNKNVGLAHRRLSIIDLSVSAHQPMTTDDGRYTIVYNGEIYNYREIQDSKLKFKKFRSSSDTEIILELYAQEGSECLKSLRGMFAFAIWDDQEKKLFAARDRFGIKPLFYLKNSQEFIFASELKAIKRLKGNLTLSMHGIDAFLKTGSIPAPLTIFDETSSLLPGHYIEVDCKGEIKINRYWHFFDMMNNPVIASNGNSKYDADAKRQIRNALLDSMQAHIVADVEVGAFLSGGIDSTAIVSLLRSVGKEKITTVSLSFPGNELDESEYSQLASRSFNTNHIEIPFYENDLLDDIDKVLDLMDQPTIDGINTYFVSKAAKSAGLKAIMSGIGGDELFCGYPSFKKIPRYQRIKSIPFAKGAMRIYAEAFSARLPAKAVEYFIKPAGNFPEYKLLRGLFTEMELTKFGWNKSFTHPFEDPNAFDMNGYTGEINEMQKISYLESTKYMANQLLRDSDLFSMAHSLELRVPFVDVGLYAAVLPYLDYKNPGKNFKKLLVDNVAGIPPRIIDREKMGFTFPFEDWVKNGRLKGRITDLLESKKHNNVFGKKEIDELLHKFSDGRLHWSRIWGLAVLSKFI